MRSNLRFLIGQKAQREGRTISLRRVAIESGIIRHTIYAIADGTLKKYPAEVIEKLCFYLDCEIGDLLVLDEP